VRQHSYTHTYTHIHALTLTHTCVCGYPQPLPEGLERRGLKRCEDDDEKGVGAVRRSWWILKLNNIVWASTVYVCGIAVDQKRCVIGLHICIQTHTNTCKFVYIHLDV